jgi:hypothetical protein
MHRAAAESQLRNFFQRQTRLENILFKPANNLSLAADYQVYRLLLAMTVEYSVSCARHRDLHISLSLNFGLLPSLFYQLLDRSLQPSFLHRLRHFAVSPR